MNISINFPAEIESRLQQRAAAAGQDVESFIQQIVTEQLTEEELPKKPRNRSHEEFRQQLHQIIALHPRSTGHVDDSRESIYAEQGE